MLLIFVRSLRYTRSGGVLKIAFDLYNSSTHTSYRVNDLYCAMSEQSCSSRTWRHYHILFRFWFRFVYAQQDRLRLLGAGAFDELVAPELPDYVSPLFERLCQETLPQLDDRQYRAVGQWWF